jgi:hypothetical protein
MLYGKTQKLFLQDFKSRASRIAEDIKYLLTKFFFKKRNLFYKKLVYLI